MKQFEHKKDMGSYGEALVVSEIIRNGCAAFTDFGDNSCVDVIVEDSEGMLHKVQVKTVGREEKTPDVTQLYLYKSGPGGYKFTYTPKMVDWFAVLDMETQKIAWVCSDEAFKCKSQVSLRHTKPGNNQSKNIRMFDDFCVFPFK
jgi:hypothetical protein